MRTIITLAIFAIMAAGCATQKQWSATGGSRADGTIKLSYEQSELEKAQLDENQAISLASKRCKTWGYNGAEAFGGTTRQCSQTGGFSGCTLWRITKEYQCSGTGENHTAMGKPTLPAANNQFGKMTYNAERLAKDWSCSNFSTISLNAPNELYSAICGEKSRVISCDTSNCKFLQ